MFRRLHYRLPRVLGILFVLFLSLFALDVFSEGYAALETILALFIHLIPSMMLLIVLLIAWRWEVWGGLLFIVLTLCFLVFVRADFITFLIIGGPALLTGLLFLLDAQQQRVKRSKHATG